MEEERKRFLGPDQGQEYVLHVNLQERLNIRYPQVPVKRRHHKRRRYNVVDGMKSTAGANRCRSHASDDPREGKAAMSNMSVNGSGTTNLAYMGRLVAGSRCH